MQLNKCDFNTGLYLENNLIFQKKVTRFHFYHLRLSCKGDGDDEDVESPFPCPYDEGRNGLSVEKTLRVFKFLACICSLSEFWTFKHKCLVFSSQF